MIDAILTYRFYKNLTHVVQIVGRYSLIFLRTVIVSLTHLSFTEKLCVGIQFLGNFEQNTESNFEVSIKV